MMPASYLSSGQAFGRVNRRGEEENMSTKPLAVLYPIAGMALCLACMAAGTWHGSLAAAEASEGTADGKRVQYIEPYNRQLIQESHEDMDFDGRLETWAVEVRRRTRHALTYMYVDSNNDGVAEKLGFSVGTHERIQYGLRDKTGDGKLDYARLRLFSFWDRRSAFLYSDLDLDGRLDLVTQYFDKAPVRRYVMLGNRLMPVDLEQGDPWEKGYRLQDKTAGDQRMVFDREKGTWCREPAPPTADDKP